MSTIRLSPWCYVFFGRYVNLYVYYLCVETTERKRMYSTLYLNILYVLDILHYFLRNDII